MTLLIHRANHSLVLQGLGYALLAERVTTVKNQRLPCLVIVGVQADLAREDVLILIRHICSESVSLPDLINL